jgi:ribosomal protein S18 acetylase RimI-like enzyme
VYNYSTGEEYNNIRRRRNDFHFVLCLERSERNAYKNDLFFQQPYTQAKFENPAFRPIVALCSDEAVGSIDLYLKEDSIEIDNFYVAIDSRCKGIGTALQQFVMEHADGKTVLLVADAADTAREMYNRQNYTYISFRYELLKVFK